MMAEAPGALSGRRYLKWWDLQDDWSVGTPGSAFEECPGYDSEGGGAREGAVDPPPGSPITDHRPTTYHAY